MLDRRNMLKTLGAGAAGGLTLTGSAEAAPAAAQAPEAQGPYARPWSPPSDKDSHAQNIVAVSDDYFVPGRFAGKTVIVTGCARGMGRMAAIRLAREGANVVGVDWLADEGRAVIDGIRRDGGKAVFVPGDVSENAVCDRMVATAVDQYGGLDAALNNAGVMDAIYPGDPIDYDKQKSLIMARIDQASDDYWDVVMRVNATGVFRCLRAELRQMMKQNRGGAIVNVASVAGLRGFGGTPSYVASKHAVNGLTKNAAIDYAPLRHPGELGLHGQHRNAHGRARHADPARARAGHGRRRRHWHDQDQEPAAIFRPARAGFDPGRTGGGDAVSAVAGVLEPDRGQLRHRRRLYHLLIFQRRHL